MRPVASHAVHYGYGEQNILFLCATAFVSEGKSVGPTWILQCSLSQMPENRINCGLDPLQFCAACWERLLCPHLGCLFPIHMYIPLLQSGMMEDILCCIWELESDRDRRLRSIPLCPLPQNWRTIKNAKIMSVPAPFLWEKTVRYNHFIALWCSLIILLWSNWQWCCCSHGHQASNTYTAKNGNSLSLALPASL